MRIILNISLLLLCCLSFVACNFSKKDKTDWAVNFSEENKNPYGLFLAYRSAGHLFPEARKEKLDVSYSFTRLSSRLKNDSGRSLIVVIGQRLNLDTSEADSILSLVSQGNQVFIAVTSIDESLIARLKVSKIFGGITDDFSTQCISLKESAAGMRQDFCYRGYPILNYFKSEDTAKDWYHTIGTTKDGDPNLVVYAIGKGKLFLHATPFVFTNYFLLQNNNQQYLTEIFGFVKPVSHVLWMNFNSRELENPSGWGVLWNNPATRMFLLIALITLLLYVLFEMRRRQKVIPVILPNANTSVAFVETIGRLYYNKGNHRNLAEKMVQHFLEFVRSNYFLNTNQLDDEFVRLLAAKSGRSKDKADTLVWHIKEVMDGHAGIDDSFLFSLHSQIQVFYKKT